MRVAEETEQMGVNILGDLGEQREVLERADRGVITIFPVFTQKRKKLNESIDRSIK